MALLTQTWILNGIVLVISAFVALYFYMTRKFNYWKKRGVMEKKPIPFFGSFYDCVTFRKSPNEFFEDLYRSYKSEKIVGFYMFDKPCLVVRDVELANRILVRDFNIFADKHAASGDHDPVGNSNLFLLKNPHWKIVRSKLTPVFTSGKLKKMFQLMVNVGKDLDCHLESFQLDGEGRVVELIDTLSKYTIDVIATCAFGLQANSLNNPEAELRKYWMKSLDFKITRAIEFGSIFFAPGLVKPLRAMFFENSCSKFLRKVFWATLTQRMQQNVRRNDLIDTLIELKKGQTQEDLDDPASFKFDGDNLIAQAAVFFGAGFKTTSVALTFALFELAVGPDIQSKLREEISAALNDNGGEFSYEWVMQLPYLDMVISEVLRKYSIIGFADRIATADYKVPDSDLVIEKGTPVYVPLNGIHRDPEYYPDPYKFDPDRFNAENKQKRPSRLFVPFADGPRNCIGSRFAMASMKLFICKFVSVYEFTQCQATVMPVRMNSKSILTEMDHGLFLHVQKIQKDAECIS